MDLADFTDATGHIGEPARLHLFKAVASAPPDAVTQLVVDLADATSYVPWLAEDLAVDASLFVDGIRVIGRNGAAVGRLTRAISERLAETARAAAPPRT